MEFNDNTYIQREGIYYPGVLRELKKSQQHLQPIFEAFTNALESINERSKSEKDFKGYITIRIYQKETTDSKTEFDRLNIEDNGIGFNSKEFDRFNTYRDFTKGYNNLGSGRFQYVHYFNETKITSKFFENGGLFKRKFKLSKQKKFLDNNAIVFHQNCKEITNEEISTTIEFNQLLNPSSLYNSLTDKELKRLIIDRYIHYLCFNKESLPLINLEYYIQNKLIQTVYIDSNEIPSVDKKESIELNYSTISSDGTQIEEVLGKTEVFSLDAFRISQKQLKSNSLKLVSKGEVVNNSNLLLENISETDIIHGDRYLFLLSGSYIDNKKDIYNNRGEFEIPSRQSFIKSGRLFNNEEILLEDMQDIISSKISLMYPSIEEKKDEHLRNLEKLKDMFLLSDASLRDINITMNDTEATILKKVYEAEAKKEADFDAKIKETLDSLTRIDTTTKEYTQQLEDAVSSIVKEIPYQNRNSLSHYVARRKIVLDLFGKIQRKELDVQSSSGRKKHEALIHNLIFEQGSTNSNTSNLWVLNEEFIYFSGGSEIRLQDIEINGEKIFKDEFEKEEEKYLNSLGQKRLGKKPDIYLFPQENKCILLELKSIDVDISEHLSQIDKYAGLILNYTKDKFNIDTFYGYLLGEAMEANDVRFADSTYLEAYNFDYMYRPSRPVAGIALRNGIRRADGSIYSEVLKYSTLLNRAKMRNKIFIDKLGLND